MNLSMSRIISTLFYFGIVIMILYSTLMLILVVYCVNNCEKLRETGFFSSEIYDELSYVPIHRIVMSPLLILIILMFFSLMRRLVNSEEISLMWSYLSLRGKILVTILTFITTDYGLIFFTLVNYLLVNEAVYSLFKHGCESINQFWLITLLLINPIPIVLLFCQIILSRKMKKKKLL